MPGAVEEEGVGLAGLGRQQEDAARRLRTTASTMSGLDTSTSCASVSSSTTAALSRPSVMRWLLGLAVACRHPDDARAGFHRPRRPDAAVAAPRARAAPAQHGEGDSQLRVAMRAFSLGLRLAATESCVHHAVADDRNRPPSIVVAGRALLATGVSLSAERAQRQRQRAHILRPRPPLRPGPA